MERPAQLARAMQLGPWPHGDPGPDIWRVLLELDQRVQLQVVGVVLDTHIAQAEAHVNGLREIRELVAKGIG